MVRSDQICKETASHTYIRRPIYIRRNVCVNSSGSVGIINFWVARNGNEYKFKICYSEQQ